MAEMLSSSSLAASFFFGRTAPGRNDSSRLIATLAYQLTVSIPSIRDHVLDQLTRDPAILKRSMDAQMQNLILEPLVTARTNSQQGRLLPRLVVIDGLDECGDGKAQRQILSVFFSAVHHSGLPLSFLISSRPEHDIRSFFNEDASCSASRRITFDNEYRNNKDVETFLRSKFADIRKFHPAGQDLPPDWPSDSDIRRLVLKASGQFAFASTAMRYVESQRHLPTERLDILFELSPHDNSLPFAELDALYTQLFLAAEDRNRVVLVFAYLIWDFEGSSTEYIENFLLLHKGELQIILQDFYSVLDMPPPGQPLKTIVILHSSFYDFLNDRYRSGAIFISKAEGHARLARCCIKHINEHISESSSFDSDWKTTAAYLAKYKLLTHLPQSCLTEELTHDLQEFPFDSYLVNFFDHEEALLADLILEEIPSIFEWLASQASQVTHTGAHELHARYMEHFDSFLRQHWTDFRLNANRYFSSLLGMVMAQL
ncbi:hypothetical protein CVT26_002653 [Gymnopilus dilepis]|uniref:Nephrocystin 3-like N-terminal domain-containing protein n=1 Tax=Gymnopilus dilepis TaxID=231916 RepID=A0A409VCJ1_9AGAR|nr:hypothetical protein CVT26_002653 [Gymnopilus dilepis]